jgi:hypothetical protein
MANALDVMPWVMAAAMLGQALFLAELVLLGVIGAPKGIQKGAALRAMLEGFWKDASLSSALVTVAIVLSVLLSLRPIGRRVFDYKAARATQATQLAHRRKQRTARKVLIILVCLFVAAAVFIGVATKWEASLVILAEHAAPAGMFCVALALKHRKGKRLVCSRCDYMMGSWRGSPAQCPECNQPWHEPWMARLGTRQISRPMLATGLILISVSVAAAYAAGVLFGRM